MKGRTLGAVAAIAVAGLLLLGCSGAEVTSSGAPPTVVCGTTIWDAAAGAIVQDVSNGGTVTHVSAGNNLFLRVNHGCGSGASVRIVPAAAGHVMKTARARDGRPAAVVIKPLQPTFDVDLKRSNGSAKTVKVMLGSMPPFVERSTPPMP